VTFVLNGQDLGPTLPFLTSIAEVEANTPTPSKIPVLMSLPDRDEETLGKDELTALTVECRIALPYCKTAQTKWLLGQLATLPS